MNTPNNKRKKESIKKIERAFVELLQSKEFKQITVSDICKIAGINRTTFYANYIDIYALADSIRYKLECEVAELYHDEVSLGYNSYDYLKLFQHIKENQIFYKTYFKLGYDDQYQIIQYDRHLAEMRFQNKFIEYHMEFFKEGLTKIIKMWLHNGCRESPEDMFNIIRSEYQGWP